MKLLFGLLVIQLVWYILKQLFTSVSVKVVDIYLAASRLGKYPPLFTFTSVNNCKISNIYKPTERDGAYRLRFETGKLSKMARIFSPFLPDEKKRTTSLGSLQIPNVFSESLLFHLTFSLNLRICWLNGKCWD